VAPAATATRFQNEKGTNPEELIAAAHAGCFTMALAFQLQTAGFAPTSLSTEAAMSLIEVTRYERVRLAVLLSRGMRRYRSPCQESK